MLACLQTSVWSQQKSGWTVATPKSQKSSATIVAAASTPASPMCPGASSLCRRQNAHFEATQALGRGLCTLDTCWRWWLRATLTPALLSLLLANLGAWSPEE